MGKKQHSKDRLYITTKEWAEEWGGHRKNTQLPYSKLPFYCCAISFTPFEDPVCSADGCVFDIVNAVPFIRAYHKNPVNGAPLELKDLTQLQFHKNAEGAYHCPVMNKVFTEHTHIVAIKTTGNVYCYEAVQELNIKPKNWKDLLTEASFKKIDIIHLQDPLNIQNRVLSNFDHICKGLDIPKEQDDKDTSIFRNIDNDTQRILKTLGTKESKSAFEGGGGGKRERARQLLAQAKNRRRPADAPNQKPQMLFKPGASTWDTFDQLHVKDIVRKRPQRETDKKPDFDPNGGKTAPVEAYAPFVQYAPGVDSTGEMATGFTSTVMAPITKNPRKMVRVDRRPKKKGYVRLHTSLGHLNVELHCDLAPRTCENFLGLCEMEYYDGTVFHRNIKGFMIQGGDPTGTGKGGESIYGSKFKDECVNRLTHSKRGVLSMANSGPHTNSSQFFILYGPAPHLDFKHSVFGSLVGGMETLMNMESAEMDNEDRPKTEIRIERVAVFCNPYKEMLEASKIEVQPEIEEEEDPKGSWFSDPALHSKEREVAQEGKLVGRYLKKRKTETTVSTPAKPIEKKRGYGDFSSW